MGKKIVDTIPDNSEALDVWAKQIEQEIADITSAMHPLQKQLEAAKEKLDLVRRLLHLSNPPQQLRTSPTSASTTNQLSTFPEIEDHIDDILRTSGSPMHIHEIRASLIRLGVPLPGKGDEANIILRIRRARDRFVRTGRGTYALRSSNLPEYSPSSKKKIVRKKRISADDSKG